VTIGASPDGQVEAIAGATRFEALPTRHLGDRQVLKTLGDRISDAAGHTRERIDRVAVADPVSCNLLVQVAATLEKQLWMVRAQLADSVRAAGTRFADANGTGRS
jgi:DNA-binding ferritin-like protein